MNGYLGKTELIITRKNRTKMTIKLKIKQRKKTKNPYHLRTSISIIH